MLHPHLPIRSMAVGGGFALFYGSGDPFNGVKGVGLNGPVESVEWDKVESFHRERASPVVIDLCPLADAGFVSLLGERGYRIGSFETVNFLFLQDAAIDHTSSSSFEVVLASDHAEWSRVMSAGFTDGGEPVRFSVDGGRVRAVLADSVLLAATVDGVPVGGATMSIVGRVALLSGAAVLPAYRRRGIQRALTAARLRIARVRECELVKMDVRAGTDSHRNAVRAGFRVAYTRPQMVRTWA
ncbi:MAG: GNAT family N-acetyltransferase [Phycisphaerae bacterium]|nr:GNAT family N-acetyltransferase [Phycisphaerae bacterium]